MKSIYLRPALALSAFVLAIPAMAQVSSPTPAPARLPTYQIIDLGEGTPLAVASDATTVISSLTAESPYRNRGGVNELLSDGRYFGFHAMNDRGDIVGVAVGSGDNFGGTAVAIRATDPTNSFTQWAQTGHQSQSSAAGSGLTTINENQTVTGYEFTAQVTNHIETNTNNDFISSTPYSLTTVASSTITFDHFETQPSTRSGQRYNFRDLSNHERGVGEKYDFSTDQYSPLYYGIAPEPSGDSGFEPYAVNDANLVAGLSNGVLKLWEPEVAAFRTIAVPNPITKDSIRITNCCGQGGAIRITDPPASDPNAPIFILAGDNLIIRSTKDADDNPLPAPNYTVFAAKKLLPKNSPYSSLALKNISNNGIIAATASKAGDSFTHAILFLPVELWALKKPGTEDEDILIDPLPPRKSDESDNAYIQRQISNTHIAFIKPHSETNDSPGMPNLVAKLPGGPTGLKVKWRLEVEYKRGNGYRAPYVEDFTRPEDTVRSLLPNC